MKKTLLLFFALIITCYTKAQYCNQTIATKVKSIEDASLEKEYYNKRAYDSLRKEVSATFEMVENCAGRNPSYEARAKMTKLQLYFALSDLAGHAHLYPEMLKNIEALERLLPSPSSINIGSLNSFTIDGTNFTSTVSSSFVQSQYYRIIEERVNYYYFYSFNYNKVIEYYEKLNGAPSDFKPASLEALLYADAMYKNGKPIEEYFPAMAKAVSLMGPRWAKEEEHDSSNINNRSLMLKWFTREIADYNRSKLNNADPTGKYRMISARGLWEVDDKYLAKQYALSASEAGHSNKEDGLWYLDIVAGDEQKHIVAALRIIERSYNSFTDAEMSKLLPLAEKYGITELAERIKKQQRQIANLRRRSKISLFPAVELAGLPFGHIPASLNLRTGRVMQEFMFDYIWGAKTKYRFGRAFAKDKGERYEFKGWSAGYAIDVLVGNEFKQGNRQKGRSQFFTAAIGLDFRYSNWNFNSITSDILNENDQVIHSSAVVNATTNRYESCVRITFVAMTRYVTVQYFLGAGVGYRQLHTAEGYDVESQRFRDQRLNGDRWNKIYMPLRLGLKVGLNVL